MSRLAVVAQNRRLLWLVAIRHGELLTDRTHRISAVDGEVGRLSVSDVCRKSAANELDACTVRLAGRVTAF